MFLVFVRRSFIVVGVAIGLLTSMLLSLGSTAMAATFPEVPSIISPEDGATAVPVAPTIQATPLADLQESTWMIYQPDASLQFLGGVQSSNSATFVADAAGGFQEIDTPVAITIDGASVAKLRIYAIGKLEALDESDAVLGRVTVQVDSSNYLPSASSPYTLVKAYSDAVSVRWFFAHDNHGEVALEALFTADGRAALRVSPSAVAEGLYTLSEGTAGCALRDNSTLREENDSLAGWKAVFDAEEFADFSLLCRGGGGGILLGTLAQPAIPALALPAIQTLTSAADILTIISEEDELESGTQYQVQVRYETTGGDFSNWSDPVSFTTDVDTNYQVDLSGNVDFEFTAGEPGVLIVNVSNEGTDAGHPKRQVRLPFNVLNGQRLREQCCHQWQRLCFVVRPCGAGSRKLRGCHCDPYAENRRGYH